MAWQQTRPEETGGLNGSVGGDPVALVQAFRRYHSRVAARTFRLHGLIPFATYKVVSWDDDEHKDAVHRTGLQLCNDGLRVTIDSTPGAAMMLLYVAPAQPLLSTGSM